MMKKKDIKLALFLIITCLLTAACAQSGLGPADPSPTFAQTGSNSDSVPGSTNPAQQPKGQFAGLIVLVLGDSHMVHKGYLIDRLHDELTAQGATVYSYGACGATPGDYLMPHKTDCGRASRIGGGEQNIEEAGAVPVWNAKELLAKHHPDLMVIVMGDTMGGYGQADFPKAWIWDQVSTLTGAIKAANVACNWVGPPWGAEGSLFDKSVARVRQLSGYLAQVVAPCHYIDSTAFAAPGQWKSIDGQHLNGAGYKAWAEAIARSLQPSPAKTIAPAAENATW
jgi:hypothetical protein